MIPDCVVRVNPQSLPESTIIEDTAESNDTPVPESEELSEETVTETENDQITEEENKFALSEAEKELLQIEREAIIKQAHTEAAQILENAQAESQKIIANANKQAEAIFQTAKDEGYNDGVQAKQNEIDSYLSSIDTLLAEMKNLQEQYFDRYAFELKYLALEIAEKIVAQKLECDDRVIIPLVRSAVKTLREVNWIKVEVSDKLKNVASELEEVLADAKSSQNIEVELRRDADAGTCVVHTADGVIVASVLTQIENIREYFGTYKESDENEYKVRSDET